MEAHRNSPEDQGFTVKFCEQKSRMRPHFQRAPGSYDTETGWDQSGGREPTQLPHLSWDGEMRASTEKAAKWGKESVSGI